MAEKSSRWKMTDVFNHIIAENANGDEIVVKLKNDICNVCKKTVAAIHAKIVSNIEEEFKAVSNIKSSLFHIVGFDILIDREFKPWLLEINSSPSLLCYENKLIDGVKVRVLSEIDQEIKLPLMTDTLTLLEMYRRDKTSLDNIDEFGYMTKVYSNSVFNSSTNLNLLNNLKILCNYVILCEKKCSITLLQWTNFISSLSYFKTECLNVPKADEIFEAFLENEKTGLGFNQFCQAFRNAYLSSKDA
mmetsp:Transcript_41296/g.47604  ORF Transcript_41296/g.47604 Transcript_41296/m.47604 type:complete len:246 (+) Transcript_41296:750-1487(+)